MNKKYLGLLAFGSVILASALTTASLMPTGVGSYSAWTPSAGSVHYTLVDETTCNGTTDYVSTATAGARDSYAVSLASVPDGATITGISLTPCASKDKQSGTALMSVFYRLNGVNGATSSAYSLSGSNPTVLAASTYSGLSVVKNASTTLESGAVYLSGSTGARLSNLATVVTYTVPAVPPTAPTNLFAFASSSMIVATWTDTSSNENGFALERSTDGVNYTLIGTTTANVTSKIDFSTATGTLYFYRAYAFNASGNSGYSNVATTSRP